MICQICNKMTATIHLTEIVDGMRREIHMCETCAAGQGLAAKGQLSINELLSGLLSVDPSDDELFSPIGEDTVCPECGETAGQLRKDGVLGCPADYEVFEDLLLPVIRKAHNGRDMHCGKVPSRIPSPTKKRMKLNMLKRQLDEAVLKEHYELAAELRDKIKQLQQEQIINSN